MKKKKNTSEKHDKIITPLWDRIPAADKWRKLVFEPEGVRFSFGWKGVCLYAGRAKNRQEAYEKIEREVELLLLGRKG